MNNLIVFEQDGKLLTDSREVANAIECRHSDLIQKIEIYIKFLADGNFRSLDYFISSTYIDAQGKERPCYNCTKIGCDMIANKLQGQKGVWFTARYIEAFEKMKEIIKYQQNTISLKEQLEAAAFVADDLRVPASNKIMMFRKVCENNYVNSNFLPDYSENEDRETKAVTTLLKEFNCNISAVKFNKLLLDAGILEERERKSTSSKTGVKKYKALTKDGEKYGKNLTSDKNSKEVQPHYYVDTFQELLKLVIQEVA